jgi:electron transfer flavoprotein beta subunit
MLIYVLLKPVPDTRSGPSYDPVRKTMVREKVPMVVNPLDRKALEAGLHFRDQFGGRVAVLSLAPPAAGEALKETLVLGADDAYLLSDASFAGSDTLVTSFILARAVEKLGRPDLILAGNSSADSGTSHVPAQLGEWLSLPHMAHVCAVSALTPNVLEVKTDLEDRFIHYRVTLPAVIAVTGQLNRPRHATLMDVVRARAKSVTTIDAAALGVTPSQTGLAASPTRPGRLIPCDQRAGKGQAVTGAPAEMAALILSRLASRTSAAKG